jgi:signal transduction histidine kinase
MRNRARVVEVIAWGVMAFAAGFIPGRIDLRSVGVQTPVMALMIVNFALTLPGRAPVLLVAFASWFALPVTHAIALHTFNPAMAIGLIPALIAAVGGRIFGSLLDTAAAQLESPESIGPWYHRPLPTRFLLATSLTFIAAFGVFILDGLLPSLSLRLPIGWLSMAWMIMSLLGWIAVAPLILRERPLLRSFADGDAPGLRPLELMAHVLIIVVLGVVHTAGVFGASVLLAFPVLDHARELVPVLFRVFLPLDFMAYLSILALGFASDVERHRRAAAQRAAALAAESLENRLAALRARLNPHFLFNALNSVTVLARSGESAQAADVVDGVTSLLRYVLDDRRAAVPLSEELEFTRQYLAVQEVRLGNRLRSSVTSTAQADAALVPQLLLQPIVENAVEHGVAKTLEGGSVTINAAATGDTLRVSVSDDGPGPVSGADGNGIGLASTRERLAHLFGKNASLEFGRATERGGTRVEIVIPLQR